MALVRQNVWELGGAWADPILWYARGVAAMQKRAINQQTSWRFFAAIHGIAPAIWQGFGYLRPNEPMPTQGLKDTYWDQCQHGSWYFLPWHRGYLFAIEKILREEVVRLNGPADWTLPYWNYFKAGQNELPPAFSSPDWPDGTGDNPLFIPQRYGPFSNGHVFVHLGFVNLSAMTEPEFTGVASGGSRGFGGIDTGFLHGGRFHGRIEGQPHDVVHSMVGGRDPDDPTGRTPGLMSNPDTAGLDPIFWLHHANIDRLWEVWRRNPTAHVEPTDSHWLAGPSTVGERVFAMPNPDGTEWSYTPGGVANLAALGYTYDDLSPEQPVPAPEERLTRLGLFSTRRDAVRRVVEGEPVESEKRVELVGASETPVPIQGSEVRTAVRLDSRVRKRVVKSFALDLAPPEPDRVFLSLENVRGLSDATVFNVYLGLPEGADPADYPDRLAGSVGLFGVRNASAPDGEHGGEGLDYSLEITPIVDTLHLIGALNTDELDVRIVPLTPVPEKAQIHIGRISVYRQGR
jgi:tyrosinase